jgi:hypothetical protein
MTDTKVWLVDVLGGLTVFHEEKDAYAWALRALYRNKRRYDKLPSVTRRHIEECVVNEQTIDTLRITYRLVHEQTFHRDYEFDVVCVNVY